MATGELFIAVPPPRLPTAECLREAGDNRAFEVSALNV